MARRWLENKPNLGSNTSLIHLHCCLHGRSVKLTLSSFFEIFYLHSAHVQADALNKANGRARSVAWNLQVEVFKMFRGTEWWKQAENVEAAVVHEEIWFPDASLKRINLLGTSKRLQACCCYCMAASHVTTKFNSSINSATVKTENVEWLVPDERLVWGFRLLIDWDWWAGAGWMSALLMLRLRGQTGWTFRNHRKASRISS